MLKSAHCFSVENTSGLALVAVMALLFFGCPAPLKPPPAPPGAEPAPSMARIEPSAYPDFSDDLDFEGLEHGIRQSIVYLQSQPPGREFEFGRDRYTAAHLLLSLQRFQGFIRNRPSGADLQKHIRTFYRVYQSAGRDQKGEVLFTGYYEPQLKGRRSTSPDPHGQLSQGSFILQLKGITLMAMSLLIKLKRPEQLLLSCIKVLNQPYRILLLMIRG